MAIFPRGGASRLIAGAAGSAFSAHFNSCVNEPAATGAEGAWIVKERSWSAGDSSVGEGATATRRFSGRPQIVMITAMATASPDQVRAWRLSIPAQVFAPGGPRRLARPLLRRFGRHPALGQLEDAGAEVLAHLLPRQRLQRLAQRTELLRQLPSRRIGGQPLFHLHARRRSIRRRDAAR